MTIARKTPPAAPEGYSDWLAQLKGQITQARQRATLAVNAELVHVPHSTLAQEALKDPYLFDFLGLGDDAHEREIESGLIRHITRFLLELGAPEFDTNRCKSLIRIGCPSELPLQQVQLGIAGWFLQPQCGQQGGLFVVDG